MVVAIYNKDGVPAHSFALDDPNPMKGADRALKEMADEGVADSVMEWVPLMKRGRYLTVKLHNDYTTEKPIVRGKRFKVAFHRISPVWRYGPRSGASAKLAAAREAATQPPAFMFRDV